MVFLNATGSTEDKFSQLEGLETVVDGPGINSKVGGSSGISSSFFSSLLLFLLWYVFHFVFYNVKRFLYSYDVLVYFRGQTHAMTTVTKDERDYQKAFKEIRCSSSRQLSHLTLCPTANRLSHFFFFFFFFLSRDIMKGCKGLEGNARVENQARVCRNTWKKVHHCCFTLILGLSTC